MIFARYGTPDKLITDNFPQFASREFKAFAAKWRFEHRTSSPHYPRSNGQAEAAVNVAKNIMRKAKEDNIDVYMALLDHRNTPRATTGMSPVEVLLQRKTRAATLPQEMSTSAADKQAQNAKTRRQQQIKVHHDKTASDLPPIPNGTKVWFADWRGMKEMWCQGQLLQVTGRSYLITTNQGTVVIVFTLNLMCHDVWMMTTTQMVKMKSPNIVPKLYVTRDMVLSLLSEQDPGGLYIQ